LLSAGVDFGFCDGYRRVGYLAWFHILQGGAVFWGKVRGSAFLPMQAAFFETLTI
jgi:hypothetical protein